MSEERDLAIKRVNRYFTVIGIIAVVLGFVFMHGNSPRAGEQTTTGVVIKTSNDPNDKRAVVQYSDSSGALQTVVGRDSTRRQPTIGSHKTVRYVPGDPSSARVVDSGNSAYWLFIAIGLIFILLASPLPRLLFPNLVVAVYRRGRVVK